MCERACLAEHWSGEEGGQLARGEKREQSVTLERDTRPRQGPLAILAHGSRLSATRVFLAFALVKDGDQPESRHLGSYATKDHASIAYDGVSWLHDCDTR